MKVTKKFLILILMLIIAIFFLVQANKNAYATPQKVLVIGALGSEFDGQGCYQTDGWSPLKPEELVRREKLIEKGEYGVYTQNPKPFLYDVPEQFHHIPTTLLDTSQEYLGTFDFVMHDWSTLKFLYIGGFDALENNLIKGISLLKTNGSMLIDLRDCYCNALTLREKLDIYSGRPSTLFTPLEALEQPHFYFSEGNEEYDAYYNIVGLKSRPTYLSLSYENTLAENLANVQKFIAYLRSYSGRANMTTPKGSRRGKYINPAEYTAKVNDFERELTEYAQKITPENLATFLNSKLAETKHEERVKISIVSADSAEMADIDHLYTEVFPPEQLAKIAMISHKKAFVKITRVK